jgi:hypothetical protein
MRQAMENMAIRRFVFTLRFMVSGEKAIKCNENTAIEGKNHRIWFFWQFFLTPM